VYLKEHYVYAYYDEQGHPYYIGKGKGGRCFAKDHNVKVPPRHRIKKLYEGLSDQQACDIETNLILKYGRQDIGTGILLNRFSKDQPFSPDIIQKISKIVRSRTQDPKYIKKLSEKIKALWQDPEYRNKMLAKRSTKEYKQKMSSSNKNYWQNLDIESKKKVIERNKINAKSLKDLKYKEFRKKQSERQKARWQDLEYRSRQLSIRKVRSLKESTI
jgi:hypothetical protein